MLEKNRAARLEEELADRRALRKARLTQLLNNIKLDTPPLVQTTIIRPTDAALGSSSSTSDTSTVKIVHKGLFPDLADALEWPIIKNLYDTDVPIPEMDVRFEEHRGEINTLIANWTGRIEGRMAELLREGRVSDGLPKESPEPTLPLEEPEPNSFQYLSTDQKMLYRADSLFEPLRGSALGVACYFDATLSAGYFTHYSYDGFSMLPIKGAFNVTTVKRSSDAQAAARILLVALGKPDATFLEMKSLGRGFACGRCHDSSMKCWEEMVRHSLCSLTKRKGID